MAIPLDLAGYEALSAARAFDQFGIDLPDDAQRWVQRLQDLRENPPQQAPHNHVATLIADAAKASEIDKAIAYQAGQAHRIQQHAFSQNIVGARALESILADRDRLHDEIAITADEAIDRLHQAAALTENITDLTRQRRTDEAHLLACAASDAEDLRAAYYLRDHYLTPTGAKWETGWWSCAQVRNPWDVKHPNPEDSTQWAIWRATIRSGGQLWFPTWEQATAESRTHEPSTTEEAVTPPINPRRGGGLFIG